MKLNDTDNTSLKMKLLMAGTSACIADLATFPLDTAKVRMQIAGESRMIMMSAAPGCTYVGLGTIGTVQPGLLHTLGTIVRNEGARSLYSGLSAGLQRQMCFASIRLGLYDTFKSFYAGIIDGNDSGRSANLFGVRVISGLTTGGLAVLFAQPTDVVKVRFQASGSNGNAARYSSTLHAYRHIGTHEGIRGLWKGTTPNIARNAIVNVAEIVCYDVIKDLILQSRLLQDGVPCHFFAAAAAGLCTTLASNPVDVVKTRYMNSTPGEYKGAVDVAVKTFMNEGPLAFYKGFIPSFTRLVSWNIVLWITYEQIKSHVKKLQTDH